MKSKGFENYNMVLTMKALCYFERISKKSFFKFDIEDVMYLLYAAFHISNPDIKMTFESFCGVMENGKIAKWAMSEIEDSLSMIQQFNEMVESISAEDKFTMDNTKTMTDFINSLIIDYGMDAHYVMYEMELWEMEGLYESINTHIKRQMELERFWTYIKVLPHIDSKKCKSPDKLVPFDWEREEKQQKQNRDLENNRFAIQNMIGKNIFGEPVEKKEGD